MNRIKSISIFPILLFFLFVSQEDRFSFHHLVGAEACADTVAAADTVADPDPDIVASVGHCDEDYDYCTNRDDNLNKPKRITTRVPTSSLSYEEEHCQCLPSHHSTSTSTSIEDDKRRVEEEGEETSTLGGTKESSTSTSTSTSARIAYLITLHNQQTLKQSITLLKSIIAPNFIILIHIDTKFPKQEYENSDLMSFIRDGDNDDHNDNNDDNNDDHNDDHKRCNCSGAIVMVDSLYDSTWGQWSMLEPTIWAMQQLTTNTQFKNKWDVFINLSADSMPVYTPKVLSQYFNYPNGPLNGINFVTSSSCATGLLPTNIHYFPKMWHKSRHYKERGTFEITYNTEYDDEYKYNHEYKNKYNEEEFGFEADTRTRTRPRTKDDDGKFEIVELNIHFGSQWMVLTPPFVEYIASSMTRHDSLPYQFKEDLIQKERLMADETFIPTLLAHHTTFRNTLPTLLDGGNLESMEEMFDIRYERMDENIPDPFLNFVEQQKYEVPKSHESSIDAPRPWGPYYLGVYDLANIKDSGALFIRKLAKEIDPNLFDLLPVNSKDEIPYIQWPNEIKISKKIDWDKLLEEVVKK